MMARHLELDRFNREFGLQEFDWTLGYVLQGSAHAAGASSSAANGRASRLQAAVNKKVAELAARAPSLQAKQQRRSHRARAAPQAGLGRLQLPANNPSQQRQDASAGIESAWVFRSALPYAYSYSGVVHLSKRSACLPALCNFGDFGQGGPKSNVIGRPWPALYDPTKKWDKSASTSQKSQKVRRRTLSLTIPEHSDFTCTCMTHRLQVGLLQKLT